MAIVQKLTIDKSKSNRFQLILRDETGEYSVDNDTGYGGTNGSPKEDFSRYIFDIFNTNTNQVYRKILDSSTDPNIIEIVDKRDITVFPSDYDEEVFKDGVLKVNMNIELDTIFEGEGYENTDIVINVPGAQFIYNTYQGIIVNDKIYYINSYNGSNLFLDKVITEDFTEFKPILKTSNTYILHDNLKDCVNKEIANAFDNCGCDNNFKNSKLIEMQFLDWGIKRSIEIEDFLQANDYINLLYNFCSINNCGC